MNPNQVAYQTPIKMFLLVWNPHKSYRELTFDHYTSKSTICRQSKKMKWASRAFGFLTLIGGDKEGHIYPLQQVFFPGREMTVSQQYQHRWQKMDLYDNVQWKTHWIDLDESPQLTLKGRGSWKKTHAVCVVGSVLFIINF